ncbi:MAG: diguanylate cyclase [Oleiphilaceae bacterium]|nr:diguanylate cyclase [Oleiphilaceae bacterium]
MLTIDDVLRLTHEVTRTGHWYIDLDNNTVFWSDEVFRIHGYEPGSFKPDFKTAINFYHPNDRQRVQKIIEQTLSSLQPLDFVARVLHQDGAVVLVHSTGEIKFSGTGRPQYLFGVFRDITEEEYQQRHNQRLARSLENTHEAIIMTDPDGKTTWVNAAFTRITGFSRDELMGNKPGELLQGHDSDPDTIEYMGVMMSRLEPFTAEILNYDHSGQTFWMRISCQPDFDENGELLGFASIQNDISSEKQLLLNLETEIDSRKVLEEQLRYIATHDELSGMPNRRHFMQNAEAERVRSRRHDRQLCVLLADLDHFKRINDEYGHAAGDAVIQAFARLCNETLRIHDLSARVGGEEFAFLLPETGLEGGRVLAERLRQGLETMPVTVGDQSIPVTVSIGVMETVPEDNDVSGMLAKADKALYEAKHKGRNRVVCAST